MDNSSDVEGLLPPSLASARTVAITGVLILLLSFAHKPKAGSTRWATVAPIGAAVAARVWLHINSHFVPEPYLDEVFHVPQAQKYCEGRYTEWDNKITTPPGLYILSLLIPQKTFFGKLIGVHGCDTESLRAVNALAIVGLTYLVMLSRQQIEARFCEARLSAKLGLTSQYAAHTALNVALFPLLFFFSGLYYTDVLSTVTVLAAFLHSLRRMDGGKTSFLSDVEALLLGVGTLFMRQTNVFWTVVFIGSLEGIHAIKTLRPTKVEQPVMSTLSEQIKFFLWRYSLGDIHDPPLHQAWPDDWLFSVLSILIAAACNPLRVLKQVWPYISVLVSFAAFVLWNGGVVLGDKSNHVATIHLAQMLYIWPFFAFFSLPMALPFVVSALNRVWLTVFSGETGTATSVKKQAHKNATVPTKDGASGKNDSSQPSLALRQAAGLFNWMLVWPVYLCGTLLASFAVVRYNTIIHPFTLADNRHYMFYVFRYTIRRGASIRYLLILPYTLCRWMVWGSLAGNEGWFFELGTGSKAATPDSRDSPLFVNHPLRIRSHEKEKPQNLAQYPQLPPSDSDAKRKEVLATIEKDPLAFSTGSVSTSTAIVLLLTSALSLITAPLVEPRYFIIPWVMWRLLIPAWRLPAAGALSRVQTNTLLGRIATFFQHYDARLVLETVWFLAINVLTGCIFLFKPFQWKAEDGSLLDAGRWQRFMW